MIIQLITIKQYFLVVRFYYYAVKLCSNIEVKFVKKALLKSMTGLATPTRSQKNKLSVTRVERKG